MHTAPSAIVIGAGIGGIATAAHLAREGYAVDVYEKRDNPGGRCSRLEVDGHRFDTGPTLYLMPEVYTRAFSDLGEDINDHLVLRRVDPSYHIHFADGAELQLTSDRVRMMEQLEAIEPGSFSNFLRYLEEGDLHYRLAMPNLVDRNFHNWSEFATPKILSLLFKMRGLRKHYSNIGRYFDDPRLKAAFTFQDMYMGLSPFDAPAMYSMLQHVEFANGVWLPAGGMYSVVEALVTIAEKHGVTFHYNNPARKIITAGDRASGVELADGRYKSADILVANADLAYIYRYLLDDKRMSATLDRKRYGCSALVFYWGLSKRFPELQTHNLFLAEDYRQSFDPIFDGLTLPAEPSFYVHAPSRIDRAMAPTNGDTFIAAFPIGHIDEASPQDWTIAQDRARAVAMRRLADIGVSDLEAHIKFEKRATPQDWQAQFNLIKGSTHGLSHDLTQMGFLRPRNRHAQYQNLYFAGASTHPGTGVPTVLISARLAVERIFEDTFSREFQPQG
jgi:phytoene desaturase